MESSKALKAKPAHSHIETIITNKELAKNGKKDSHNHDEFNIFSSSSISQSTSQVSSAHGTNFLSRNTYQVQFQINYQTNFGEEVYMVGGLPELGNWNSFTQKLKWTQGHNWISNTLTITRDYFEYKYVIVDSKNKQAIRWEGGFNRIADLLLLQTEQSTSSFIQKDEWERFTIVYSIYYPLKDEKNEYMRINGDVEKLGMWNKGTGPVRMEHGDEITWLTGQKRSFIFVLHSCHDYEYFS